MSQKVNLDALIPRSDFETDETASAPSGRPKDTFSVNDLQKGEFFYSYLRKPDFQRETSEWDPKKICNLISSFLNDDLIPAVILWRSDKNLTFVIDGSHRISALAAWVNDDYGDGEISKDFFDSRIPEDQIEYADKTRKLVEKEIGSFSDFKRANSNPEKVRPDIAERARKLGPLAIQLQWVTGSAVKAEESFFTINQQASPINPTELKILRARKRPYGIATRAIFRAGQGHKYWAEFSIEVQRKIEENSNDIHGLLFTPRLKTPIKTLDIPIGGKLKSANALALILDFVCIANGIKIESEKSVLSPSKVEKDDGSSTLKLLYRCLDVVRRVNSVYPSSLGLHPIVYFYSKDGVHKVASFYAFVSLVIELEKRNSWNAFIDVRNKFEEFLISHDDLIQQIVRKHRGALASHEHVRDFLLLIIRELQTNEITKAVETALRDARFIYLKLGEDATAQHLSASQDFTREVKSRAYISKALEGVPRCAICGGFLHVNSITTDHVERKRTGGAGSNENAQLAHPYCNSTYKH
ncbi:MAG: DUF262 domain-containing protein [Sideroxyarcus sp.]|nr:DUF262 domain-containing protein [Sideroxyarcus sp.]